MEVKDVVIGLENLTFTLGSMQITEVKDGARDNILTRDVSLSGVHGTVANFSLLIGG